MRRRPAAVGCSGLCGWAEGAVLPKNSLWVVGIQHYVGGVVAEVAAKLHILGALAGVVDDMVAKRALRDCNRKRGAGGVALNALTEMSAAQIACT